MSCETSSRLIRYSVRAYLGRVTARSMRWQNKNSCRCQRQPFLTLMKVNVRFSITCGWRNYVWCLKLWWLQSIFPFFCILSNGVWKFPYFWKLKYPSMFEFVSCARLISLYQTSDEILSIDSRSARDGEGLKRDQWEVQNVKRNDVT